MVKVVVTGGAGFIGSHLSNVLVRQGASVLVLDNLFTGKRQVIPKGATFNNVSILSPELLQLFQGVDIIFHLAAIASVPQSVKDPTTTAKVNIGGTLNVLQAAWNAKVKRVVFASSSAVYGNSTNTQQKEEDPLNPCSPYAQSKRAGEELCSLFSEQYSLPTTCLRLFNVYGPGQNPKGDYALAIPAFVHKLGQGQAPTIYGDGEQSRDFIYIIDVVEAFLFVTRKELTGIFNVGSGKGTSVNALASSIAQELKSGVKPIHEAPRRGDPRSTCADISKLVKTGFKPKCSLEDGLRRMITNGYQT